MNNETEEAIYTSPEEVILDSRTIELNKYFGEVDSLPQLLVLVEDEDDKPFWFKVFSSCVGSLYSSIDVWPLKKAVEEEQPQTDADGNVLTATGKDSLMKVVGLGRNKMVAVDADYDQLIDDLHSYTNRVRTDKYVQHTVYYAIENHLLDNPNIIALPELSTFITNIQDYVYAIIGEMKFHLQELANSRIHKLAITIDQLRSAVGSLQYKSTTYEQNLKDILSTEFDSLVPSSLPMYDSAKTLCSEKGYNECNLWKIIQGHTLYEFVEKVMASAMLQTRETQESTIKKDNTISGTKKGEMIQELKRKLLGDFNNEKEKFRNDVYNGTYMDMTLSCIQSIQRKILNDLDIKVS